jgi:hypothetical protein
VKETVDDKAPAIGLSNAACLHVKEFADLTRGCAMGASDIVGLNFQTGHRICFCLIAEHEVTHFLVGVRLVRARLDLDETRKDRAGGIIKRVEISRSLEECGTT